MCQKPVPTLALAPGLPTPAVESELYSELLALGSEGPSSKL